MQLQESTECISYFCLYICTCNILFEINLYFNQEVSWDYISDSLKWDKQEEVGVEL